VINVEGGEKENGESSMPRKKARREKVSFYATTKRRKKVKVTFYARRKTATKKKRK
jgi:hypothetical protein